GSTGLSPRAKPAASSNASTPAAFRVSRGLWAGVASSRVAENITARSPGPFAFQTPFLSRNNDPPEWFMRQRSQEEAPPIHPIQGKPVKEEGIACLGGFGR